MRKQSGSITQFNKRWYVRYWERRLVDGNLERKRATHYLGPVTGRSKKPPDDIVKAAEDHMQGVKDCTIPAERIISLADFVENIYLPMVKENYRPSTYKGYRAVWKDHIKGASSLNSASLREIKCFDVQGWLDLVGKEKLSRNSLKRIQSSLSGIFKFAKQAGFYDGVNPCADTRVNRKAAAPAKTYAYTLEEIWTILCLLPEPAATAFAVAAYSGLRRGEIEGLTWEDYRDGELHVERSIWNGRECEPKTNASRAPVPVIKQLRERLELHRARSGSPETGPIFRNTLGKRESVNNLLSRHILPALNRCEVCRLPEGKRHLKQAHDYKRDASLPEWRGWHACRRGVGTNLHRLGCSSKDIQVILRHSNVKITESYYILPVGKDAVRTMEKLEQRLDEQSAAHAVQLLQDSAGTVKTGSGATPGSVN